MRIRGSSSFSSSYFSSSDSFSSSHSLSSSSSSFDSSSLNSSSLTNTNTRCEGLDLLVKAVGHIPGPFLFGIPFTQKKVVRRGKRALRFKETVIKESEKGEKEMNVAKEKKESGIELNSEPDRQRRLMSLPSKYQDSVLQPWKRKTRRS